MKRTLAFFISCYLISNICFSQGKIFIYINSHNEDNIGYLNGPGGYMNYMQSRNALIQLATLTLQKGAKQNWGSDHVALRAIARFDTGSTLLSTNGKNLARFMSEDRGVECDPHSHETTYNYGDVAYFMNELGVTPSGNISGFLYNQLQNGNNWEDYQDGIQGDSFPAYTWYPEVLWGGGTPNHVADLNYYGLYKIKSMAEPQVHEPTNHLTLLGTGCTLKLDDTSTVAYNMRIIHRLVNAVEDGTLPANGIYTQEIMCNEGKMKQPYFLPLMTEMIDSVNVLVAAGKVEWANLSEILNYWKTTYNSVPFVVDCDFNTVIGLPTGVVDFRNENSDIRIQPNPFFEEFTVSRPELSLSQASGLPFPVDLPVQVFDLYGRKIYEVELQTANFKVQTIEWKDGVYFLKAGNEVFKILKQ